MSRKPKPETAQERVERMARRLAEVRVRLSETVDPLERGRLRMLVLDREAGLAIFQRTFKSEVA